MAGEGEGVLVAEVGVFDALMQLVELSVDNLEGGGGLLATAADGSLLGAHALVEQVDWRGEEFAEGQLADVVHGGVDLCIELLGRGAIPGEAERAERVANIFQAEADRAGIGGALDEDVRDTVDVGAAAVLAAVGVEGAKQLQQRGQVGVLLAVLGKGLQDAQQDFPGQGHVGDGTLDEGADAVELPAVVVDERALGRAPEAGDLRHHAFGQRHDAAVRHALDAALLLHIEGELDEHLPGLGVDEVADGGGVGPGRADAGEH